VSIQYQSQDIQPGQIWQHYKGGVYEIITLARRERDSQWVVCYRQCLTDKQKGTEKNCPWVRELNDFLGFAHEPAGSVAKVQNRFDLVRNALVYFTVDSKRIGTTQHRLTAKQITEAAGYSFCSVPLHWRIAHEEGICAAEADISFKIVGGMEFRLFYAKKPLNQSCYFVEGEMYLAEEMALSPDEILLRYGGNLQSQFLQNTEESSELPMGIPIYLDGRAFRVCTRG
jgi:hypothetical protein